MTGEQVRRTRKRMGFTQAELAERMGTTRVTVARWEIGLVPVPKMAAILLRLLAQQARKRPKGGE